MPFAFPQLPRSGREVVIIEDLVKTYNDDILFLGANLLLERGDRVAILGPNGSGKSTLLHLLAGLDQADEGTIKLGEHNVIPGYFEQNQAEALDLHKTVIETLHDEVPDLEKRRSTDAARTIPFQRRHRVQKGDGFEWGRKSAAGPGQDAAAAVNLLMLDEPTNHLDIPAKEMLESALKNYEGTVLIVSHDRYFISQVATKIVEIHDGELRLYQGDYQYYQEKIAQEKEQARLAQLAAEKAAKAAAKRAKQKGKKKGKAKTKA